MSEDPRPPSLSVALRSVVGAAVDAGSRAVLLSVVQPADGEPRVIPFPTQRQTPADHLTQGPDDPDAA